MSIILYKQLFHYPTIAFLKNFFNFTTPKEEFLESELSTITPQKSKAFQRHIIRNIEKYHRSMFLFKRDSEYSSSIDFPKVFKKINLTEDISAIRINDDSAKICFIETDIEEQKVTGYVIKRISGIVNIDEDELKIDRKSSLFYVPFEINFYDSHTVNVSVAKFRTGLNGYTFDKSHTFVKVDGKTNALSPDILVLEILDQFSKYLPVGFEYCSGVEGDDLFRRLNIVPRVKELLLSEQIKAKHLSVDTEDRNFKDQRGLNRVGSAVDYVNQDWVIEHVTQSEFIDNTRCFFVDRALYTTEHEKEIYLSITPTYGIIEVPKKGYCPLVVENCTNLLLGR